MPRQPRLQFPGQPLHVIQRGVNKGDCFQSDADRTLYLGLLAELATAFGCQVHAYALMTNHVHLLVTSVPTDGLSLMMRNLGQRYVQAFNRRHTRTGPLWNSRFKASLVDSERYLWTCYRYVESNPVRARMVADAALYPWSSHCANAYGIGSFITPHPLYAALGTTNDERQSAYRDLFSGELSEQELVEIRSALNRNLPLAGEDFLARMELSLGRTLRPGQPGRPRRKEPAADSEQLNLAASPV
jgi:putative transposase